MTTEPRDTGEPTTEAGRALVHDGTRLDAAGRPTDTIYVSVEYLTERILAIEAEAIAAAVERVSALPGNYARDRFIRRDAAIAAIREGGSDAG